MNPSVREGLIIEPIKRFYRIRLSVSPAEPQTFGGKNSSTAGRSFFHREIFENFPHEVSTSLRGRELKNLLILRQSMVYA